MSGLNGVGASSEVNTIKPKNKQNGSIALNTAIAGVVGGGAGYGVSEMLLGSFAKDAKALLKDPKLIEKQVTDYFQSIASGLGGTATPEQINKGVKDATKAQEDILKMAKSARIKYIGFGAAALAGIYLGCKALFGKKDS